MRAYLVVIVAALAAFSACKQDREQVTPPDIALAFPTLIVPPGAELVSRGGGVDAAQITMRAPGSVEGVADYFREHLTVPGWRLVSDSRDSAGTVLLYAEGPKRPMWIQVGPAATGVGVEVVMTGAVPGYDTTFARKQAAARDTTNTLRPR